MVQFADDKYILGLKAPRVNYRVLKDGDFSLRPSQSYKLKHDSLL